MYALLLPSALHRNWVNYLSYETGAGISDTAGTNRTLWPLDGGSLNVAFHDGAAIMFVNLGLGVNPTNFNISLLTVPLNETGAENLCFPKLTLPFGLPIEGTQASIQFATSNPKMAKGYTMWVYQGPNTRALWPISISHSVPISPLAAMPPSYRLTSV